MTCDRSSEDTGVVDIGVWPFQMVLLGTVYHSGERWLKWLVRTLVQSAVGALLVGVLLFQSITFEEHQPLTILQPRRGVR
jgi:hypothetical protein